MLIIDNEFRNLISQLTREEFEQLENNIISEGGIHDPIITWNNIIVDGHNRYDICSKNNIKYFTKELELTDRNQAINWIIDNQLGRRNLAPWQQSILRGKRYNAEKKNHGGERTSYQFDNLKTHEKLATQYGVSPATITRDGNFAIAAEKAAETFEQPIMQLTKQQILEVAKEIQQEKREQRRNERIEKLVEITENNKPLEGIGIFPVIYADPPWQYEHPISDSRRIENQYPTMTIEDICNLPVNDIATDDAIIFLWATTPMLKKGFQVLDAWGFEYRTCMVWVKPSIGPGHWVRNRHELLLIGVKGNIPTPKGEDKPDSVIEAPRQEHSKKPEIVYDIIEKMYPELEKVELFCRQPRQGWKAWGNQS